MPAALTALAASIPLIYVFVRAASSGGSVWMRNALSGSSLALTGRTLLLVAGVVLLSLLVAAPMAWLVARTDLRARRFWAVLGALPLVFPSYVAAFSLVAVFGPRGFLQVWLEPWGVERLPAAVYGYSGALICLALFTYPYLYLLLVASLRSVDPELEEGSRSLGRGRWATLWLVVLPQLRPAIYSGALLVALYTVSDFGAVSIVRYDTLTLAIYNAYEAMFDRGVAAAVSSLLVAVALGLILVQTLLIRRVRPGRAVPRRPAKLVALGRAQWPCQLALSVFGLFTLGMPVGVIAFWAIRAIAVGNPLGAAGRVALNSIGPSALAAVCSVALALAVATWAVRYPGWMSRTAERLAYSGYALPGLVIALALVFLAARHMVPIYQTLGLLVAAYVIRFLPEALAAVRASLAGVAPRFEEAGRSLGRSPAGVLRAVTVPMIRPGLLAGAGLVFLTAMKELPATLILQPIGFETLATRIWSAASEGVFSEAALPALVLVLASAVPVYVLIIRPALAARSS